MKSVLFVALLVAAFARPQHHELSGYTFDRYEVDFNKAYSGEEREQRKELFTQRLHTILTHNADATHSWKRGVNQFTDRSAEELSALRGLDKAILFNEKHMMRTSAPPPRALPLSSLPASVDWRSKSAITPVKNQGHCGACWAFASTETLESHWFLATGIMQELSEQFILDCTPNPNSCGGTGGCMGGTAKLAYDQLKVYGGMPSEWTYPYLSGHAGEAGKCHGLPLSPQVPHSGSVMRAANVTGHVSLPANSYEHVMSALATLGPLTVSVDASAWHDYEGGVYTGGNHTNPDLDHLVQLVGYGTTSQGQDYWLVRNSWTPWWGELGYIRLARYGAKGKVPCGEDITPQDGDGCKNGPPEVKVCGQSGVLYDGVYPLVK